MPINVNKLRVTRLFYVLIISEQFFVFHHEPIRIKVYEKNVGHMWTHFIYGSRVVFFHLLVLEKQFMVIYLKLQFNENYCKATDVLLRYTCKLMHSMHYFCTYIYAFTVI